MKTASHIIIACVVGLGCSGVGGSNGTPTDLAGSDPGIVTDPGNPPADPGPNQDTSDPGTPPDVMDDVCSPACTDLECGDDGCGGTCGTCDADSVCVAGLCECEFEACNTGCCPEGRICWFGGCCLPSCDGKECGDDGCGNETACGVCTVGQTCWFNNCCDPDCDGKECGADGCGDLCGECVGLEVCADGTCCLPDCDGKECGDDGCGASCGACMANMVCEQGTCVDDPGWVGCSDGTREGFIHINDYPLIAACTGAWDKPGIHNVDPACDRKAGNTGDNPEGTGCNVSDLCAAGWHVCLGKLDVMYRSSKGCEEIMAGAESPAFFLTRTSSTGAFNCAPDAIGDVTTVNDIFGCGDLGCPMKQGECADGKECKPGVACTTCAPDKECADGSACTPAICWPLTLGSHDGCKAIRNKPTSSCTCYFYGELEPTDPKYVDGDMTNVTCKPNSGGCGWCKPLDYWNKKLGVSHPDAWDCGGGGSSEAADVVKDEPYYQGGVLCCGDQCAADADCGGDMECVMSTCQEKN